MAFTTALQSLRRVLRSPLSKRTENSTTAAEAIEKRDAMPAATTPPPAAAEATADVAKSAAATTTATSVDSGTTTDAPAPTPAVAEDIEASTQGLANGEIEVIKALPRVCAELDDKVTRFLAEEGLDEGLRGVQEKVRLSMDVISEALRRYTPEELSLSYNGGKDCLVLLILLLAALHRHNQRTAPAPSDDPSGPSPATPPPPQTLQAIYIVPPHPFPEVDNFVARTSRAYSLTLTRSPLPMRPALSAYLSANPSLRAIFVGTRRTDPHGATLTHFDETDGDWPRFMRVHPVLDWHYAEIWSFIRRVGIEYCGLYDQGYTSLGGTTDTLPNPALRRAGVEGEGEGERSFRPAYELISDHEERLGRE